MNADSSHQETSIVLRTIIFTDVHNGESKTGTIITEFKDKGIVGSTYYYHVCGHSEAGEKGCSNIVRGHIEAPCFVDTPDLVNKWVFVIPQRECMEEEKQAGRKNIKLNWGKHAQEALEVIKKGEATLHTPNDDEEEDEYVTPNRKGPSHRLPKARRQALNRLRR